MTRRPVSTPVRALAAFSYLLPVAIVLLVMPAYRQVRLIRVHALASLILGSICGFVVLLFGALRPGSLEAALLVGVVISAALTICFGFSVWGAIWAYQGKPPPAPGVKLLAERLEKRLAPHREAK